MEFNSIYLLRAGQKRGYGICIPESLSEDWLGISKGKCAPPDVLRFYRDMGGKKAGDLIGSVQSQVRLISSRMRKILIECGFTGWSAIPCELAGFESDDEFYFLVYKGQCGPLKKEMAPIVDVPPPVPGGSWTKSRKGVFFDPGSWDGSDIFSPEGTWILMVTQRVIDAIAASKLANVEWKPISEILYTY